MIALLMCLFMQPLMPSLPELASRVEWTGNETITEVLKKLNATGNVVIDGRAARGQATASPALKMPPGKQTFWQALDELCAEAKLQWVYRDGRIELFDSEGGRTMWFAYYGALRGRIVRRSLIAYEDPSLNRLLCQMEVMLEPRLQPLLLTYQSFGKEHPGKAPSNAGSTGTISFDGEQSKIFEVRLHPPPRSLTTLDQIRIDGKIWLAPGKLNFTLPFQANATDSQERVKCTISQISKDAASQLWEVTTHLDYPPGSKEWESHQSRLFSSMKLILTDGTQQINDVGKDIRTDTGNRIVCRWLFRNVPATKASWKAQLTAPATPVEADFLLFFNRIDLP